MLYPASQRSRLNGKATMSPRDSVLSSKTGVISKSRNSSRVLVPRIVTRPERGSDILLRREGFPPGKSFAWDGVSAGRGTCRRRQGDRKADRRHGWGRRRQRS